MGQGPIALPWTPEKKVWNFNNKQVLLLQRLMDSHKNRTYTTGRYWAGLIIPIILGSGIKLGLIGRASQTSRCKFVDKSQSVAGNIGDSCDSVLKDLYNLCASVLLLKTIQTSVFISKCSTHPCNYISHLSIEAGGVKFPEYTKRFVKIVNCVLEVLNAIWQGNSVSVAFDESVFLQFVEVLTSVFSLTYCDRDPSPSPLARTSSSYSWKWS